MKTLRNTVCIKIQVVGLLKQEMSIEKVSAVLAGIAIFLMNLISVMGRAGALNFYAISFTFFVSLNDQDVIVPNISFYPAPASFGFLDKPKESGGGNALNASLDTWTNQVTWIGLPKQHRLASTQIQTLHVYSN